MDIFTILVFFLLLNSGDSQEIENAEFVELPDSSSGMAPHTDLHITISDEEIFLGDEVIATIAEVVESQERVIEPLAERLEENTSRLGELSSYERNVGLAVTIRGDRSVPYSLLKTVMTTCQQSDYRNISLAVNRVSGNEGVVEPSVDDEQSPQDTNQADAVSQLGEGG